MTEAEFILADLVLLKLPVNREFTQRGAYNDVLFGKQSDYNQDTIAEMNKIVSNDNSLIIDFLLKEKYINCTNQMHGRFILTEEKGEIAQREGGHNQYLKWKENEEAKLKKGEAPKRNTIIYDALKIAVTLILGIIIGKYSCNQPLKADNDQSEIQQETKMKNPLIPASNFDTTNKGDSLKTLKVVVDTTK